MSLSPCPNYFSFHHPAFEHYSRAPISTEKLTKVADVRKQEDRSTARRFRSLERIFENLNLAFHLKAFSSTDISHLSFKDTYALTKRGHHQRQNPIEASTRLPAFKHTLSRSRGQSSQFFLRESIHGNP